MARLARLELMNQLHYVRQRGHNHESIFKDALDCHFFLDTLRSETFGKSLDLHAFAIEANTWHLLLTPRALGILPSLMQSVGRRYAPYFNRRHGRTGGLWDGRYKATVLDARAHLMDVMVWMAARSSMLGETLSVGRAEISSESHYLGHGVERCLTPHTLWWKLANTPFAREKAFAERLAEGLPALRLAELDKGLGSEWVMGDAAFLAAVQPLAQRRLVKLPAGRPAKSAIN
jgi:putative transposase